MEYLSNITQRTKWTNLKDSYHIGDVAMLVKTDQPRNLWRLGCVSEVHPGANGLVRNVTVRLSTKRIDSAGIPKDDPVLLKRPIQKLVPLMPQSSFVLHGQICFI